MSPGFQSHPSFPESQPMTLRLFNLFAGYWCSAKTSKSVKEETKRTATRNGEAGETEVKDQKRFQEGEESSILEREV